MGVGIVSCVNKVSKVQVFVDLEVAKIQWEVESTSNFMLYGVPWSYGASFWIGNDVVVGVDNEVGPMGTFWIAKCVWLLLIS